MLSCSAPVEPPADPAGLFRAVLASPGGDLPFFLRLARAGEESWTAVVLNGSEEVPASAVRVDDHGVEIRFDHYDSVITAAWSAPEGTMKGTWERQAGRERPKMAFRAEPGASHRFDPPAKHGGGEQAEPRVEGAWDATFTDDKESFPARAEFSQAGDLVTGTFLTPTGDYRFLAGDYRDGLLRLSCFDGAHAFLFEARAAGDGTLDGDFWSRGSYHATWTARRAVPEGEPTGSLPDPFAMTTLTNPTGRLTFTFPDLAGNPVSLSDVRFAGKVVLVDIFGSWCPNCNDEAPLLAQLYREYHDRGLEIVGLAYEMTGDPGRDAAFVRKYADRHGVSWPLLLAGTSDKPEASKTLPDLSGVLAFPTLIFVGRDGRVAAIHTGFAGPGTGRHHQDQRALYRRTIDALL